MTERPRLHDTRRHRKGPARRLDRLARQAGWALTWEGLWPGLVAALAVIALFLAVSFLGLWLEAPRWGRIAGATLFAIALGVAFGWHVRVRPFGRPERLARVDRDSGLPHRPATSFDDTLANASQDPATRALWDLHQRRAEAALTGTRIAAPAPRLSNHDRHALRGAALVALVATAFIAGPEKYARVLAAFDWRTAGAVASGYRLDAWVDPPAYTGRPPIVLALREDAGSKGAMKNVSVPVGSALVVRSSEGANVSVEVTDAIVAPKSDDKAQPKPAAAAAKAGSAADHERRWRLTGNGSVTFKRFGTTLASFAFATTPDRAPTITLKGEPTSNLRGSLTVGYTIDDDYGIVGADAQFSKPIVAGRPVTGRSLSEPPKMPLGIANGPGGLGDAETTADLSEHPWAGARVTMVLTARDEAENEGSSAPVAVTLPQRPFVKPLAKALVEQRRNLVLDPDNRKRVETAMAALMLAPEKFGTTSAIYLGLTSIAYRLAHARSDPQLLDVADLMWEMALRVEDGGLSEAERDLRTAEQQLRDALQRGASDEEVKKLMDQLRAAMDKFVNELAQQAQRDQTNPDQQNRDANSRTLTQRDLHSLLDRMQEMAKNGNLADAQRMLDQLQQMMENLQAGRQQQRQQNPMAREMNRALDELDSLTREQQQLRDQTFRRDSRRADRQQQRRQQGQQGQRGQQQQPGEDGAQDQDEGDQSADNEDGDQQSLQQRQQALRDRLEQLQKRMKELGVDPKDGLDEAGDAMKQAEGQLGDGDQGKAVGSQGRALEALRKGAQALAQQMQPGDGPGEMAGPGEPSPGQPRQGRDNANSDPLGREAHDRRDNTRSTYDPLGVPAAQRAQRVLEELRKRLGDVARPREELDYLERLLRRY